MTDLTTLQLAWQGHGTRPFHYRTESIGDAGVVAQVLRAGDYDLAGFALTPRVTRYADAAVLDGRRLLIIDAGANIGASAVWFAGQYPAATIVAIEPEAGNCALLRRNTEGLDVLVVNGAVGSEPGTLFLTDPGEGDWGFRVEETGASPVAVVTIPQMMAVPSAGGSVPFICKIDIEGGEARLFEKDYAWLDRFPLVILELHDWLLPGLGNSRTFLAALTRFDFDFVCRGEHAFCFNNRLLGACSP